VGNDLLNKKQWRTEIKPCEHVEGKEGACLYGTVRNFLLYSVKWEGEGCIGKDLKGGGCGLISRTFVVWTEYCTLNLIKI
jgi:hypothetical protein